MYFQRLSHRHRMIRCWSCPPFPAPTHMAFDLRLATPATSQQLECQLHTFPAVPVAPAHPRCRQGFEDAGGLATPKRRVRGHAIAICLLIFNSYRRLSEETLPLPLPLRLSTYTSCSRQIRASRVQWRHTLTTAIDDLPRLLSVVPRGCLLAPTLGLDFLQCA